MNPVDKTPLNVGLGDAPELLIEASAGTGKTYALTTLAARLLVEKRVEIGELLVVTFTIAATGELRDRLRATLRAALRRAQDDAARPNPQAASLLERWQDLGIDRADIARLLELALLDLDRANVMTIHGFCQRVLADFAFEGGLPFAFEVAGDGADALNAATTDDWRRWAYPASPLLVRYAMKKHFAADELADWLSDYVARPDLEIAGAESSTEAASSELHELESAWRDAVGNARDTHEAEAASLPEGDRDRIAALLQRAEVVLCRKDGSKDSSYLGNKTESKRLHKGNPALADVLDALDQASGNLRAGYDGLLPCLRRDALQNTRALLDSRVREDRKLGFDDLLTGVYQALHGGQGLARRIRDRYPWALIDEYQDTDRVQAEIFRRIYRDARPADATGALIIVGDPKQSIYRFRSADIFAYLNTSDAVADDAKLSLSSNYRSVPALTAAVNTVFDHPCPFALPGIGYDPVESAINESKLVIDGETVAGGGDSPFQMRYFPWVPGKYLTKPNMGDLAARLAADEIAALLGLADQDRAKLDDRPVRGSDIAVLVRTAVQGQRVARALHERHIASVEIGIESVMASREAEQLERLLWAIAKQQSPPRTRGALTADVLGLDAAAVGALQDDDNAWNIWTERLGDWLQEWKRSDVATLIRRILESEEVKGADCLLRYRDGARRLTNLKHLAELLQEAETRERYSPTGLAAWFTRARANAGDRDELAQLRLDSDEQLVKIVTMHAAKGLEFPIVFCPFLWDANRRNDQDWANYHSTESGHREILHLGPSKPELDIDWQEDFSDEARLLYVALTRARERCVVTWTKILSTENAPLAWLLYGRESASEHVDAATLVEIVATTKGIPPEPWRAGLDDLASRCSADIGIVDVDLGFKSPSSARAAATPPELTVRRLVRELARVRQMSSYSALAHSAGAAESPNDHETVEQPDRDEVEVTEDEEETTAEGESARNVFTFPSGPRVGNCLHRIFERLDRGEEGSVEEACRESLARYRIDAQWVDVAQSMVANTRATLLAAAEGPGVGKGFRLGDVERAVPEMEFHLPLEGLDRRRLGETLAEHGYDNPFAGARSNIEGYLRGFIDLVAGHDGVWYVLDYKSNWLGNRPDDYRPAGLATAMRDHRYPLQYLLYLVALNRYLAGRLPGYDYDRHVGGAFYLFLRGIDPAAGMDRGVYFDRPSRACIEALDACFRAAA